ncbi:alpha-L-fucosidase [Planctomycetota bacterium]
MKMMKHTTSPIVTLLLLLATALSALGAQIIPLRPNDVTTMVAGRATRNLESSVEATGFTSSSDTVTWTVNAPQADDYAVSVIYRDPPMQQVELRCGESAVTAPALVRIWPEKPFFMRQELPGVLHLKKGENQIQFRLPELKADKPAKGFVLWSIELGTPAARKAQLERAKKIRGDASWMIEGKYGLFVHWSSAGYALNGNQPRSQWHEKAVDMFDVKVFADAVERTGAAWVVFTAIHAGTHWAGPNEALDKVRPGCTTKRDLIGEIITELDQRGIRTLLYMHASFGRKSNPAKSGYAAYGDTTQYGDDIEAILRDASLRYGKKLAGFGYIDGAMRRIYPQDPPWERWVRAIKAGNPDAVVGFSSNRGPTVSPFSELAVTDGGRQLSQPEPTAIGPGRQLGDVTPAWWCAMDSWIVKGPMNGKIGKGPKLPAEEYVRYFKQMAAAKIPVTINLVITADVTADHPIFNPDCMAIMEEVRKAIRGK